MHVHHTQTVITYQGAYVARSVDVCTACVERGVETADTVRLGPVLHGQHHGRCVEADRQQARQQARAFALRLGAWARAHTSDADLRDAAWASNAQQTLETVITDNDKAASDVRRESDRLDNLAEERGIVLDAE